MSKRPTDPRVQAIRKLSPHQPSPDGYGWFFAVKRDALRSLRWSASSPAPAPEPGEVVVIALEQGVGITVPGEPSDLAFEVWRLVRHCGRSYGQVAVSSPVARYLAPRSRAKNQRAVRVQLAKKYVRQIDAYLKTWRGEAVRESSWWQQWLQTGEEPGIRLVPFEGYNPGAPWQENYLNYQDHLKANRRKR